MEAGGGISRVPVNRGKRKRRQREVFLITGTIVLAGFASCAQHSPSQKPVLRTTKAFEAIFGELPPLPLSGPSFATVAYFPSSVEPGKFRPVPIFSVEQGKEEALVVRTVVRGIRTLGSPADTILAEIVPPFPAGGDLASVAYDGGVAKISVGGNFRAESLSAAQREKAAQALALTVSQFGKADRVEVSDGQGTIRFSAGAAGTEVVDIGSPKVLGLLAIRDEADTPPAVLSVLFDRPVFVEDAAFFPAGEDTPIPGRVYSTGFGMSLEFHPEGKAGFDPGGEYTVRLMVRDGKGRKTAAEQKWKLETVVRH